MSYDFLILGGAGAQGKIVARSLLSADNSWVRIVYGHTSRQKIVEILGR